MTRPSRSLHAAQSHIGWDNSVPPALTVSPGEILDLELLDASGGQITADSSVADVVTLDFGRVNPVTGPIFVDGAEPGDAIQIDVLEFEGSGWGWTALIPGFGLLSDDFPDPTLHISRYSDEGIEFLPGIRLPYRPFTGTIGLAPAAAGLHSVVPPREVGGNLDIRDLTIGTRLYLPVQVAGGLLSVGDGHAAQGDGEVCGTAIETPVRVQLRVELVKHAGLRRPRFEMASSPTGHVDSRGYDVTTGIAPDLMTAARDAIRDMIDHLGRRYQLDPTLAYMLCSVAVDLRINEVVDAPNWVVGAYLPNAIFV